MNVLGEEPNGDPLGELDSSPFARRAGRWSFVHNLLENRDGIAFLQLPKHFSDERRPGANVHALDRDDGGFLGADGGHARNGQDRAREGLLDCEFHRLEFGIKNHGKASNHTSFQVFLGHRLAV